MAEAEHRPITVALVDDYDVVLMGVAKMFDRYRDRVVVAELDSNMGVEDAVDIVLYDSFAQPESDHEEIAVLVGNPRARRVVVYTWNFHPDLIESARQQGAHGYLSKTLPARELVAALEAVHAGETVISDVPPRARSAVGLDWPGRGEGLSDRESETWRSSRGQEQRRSRDVDLPQPEYREVLHPHDLPKDRGRQPDAGRPLGCEARFHARPQPHRTLAGRTVSTHPQ